MRIITAVETCRAQAELAEERRRIEDRHPRLEGLFEQSPNMISVHDDTGTITDTNPAICGQTGYDESDPTEMKVRDIDQTLDSEAARSMWAKMEVGEREEVEGAFERRDGPPFQSRSTSDGSDWRARHGSLLSAAISASTRNASANSGGKPLRWSPLSMAWRFSTTTA